MNDLTDLADRIEESCTCLMMSDMHKCYIRILLQCLLNKSEIRNPRLIYAGQEFVLPAA